jgi:hypothetical protein
MTIANVPLTAATAASGCSRRHQRWARCARSVTIKSRFLAKSIVSTRPPSTGMKLPARRGRSHGGSDAAMVLQRPVGGEQRHPNSHGEKSRSIPLQPVEPHRRRPTGIAAPPPPPCQPPPNPPSENGPVVQLSHPPNPPNPPKNVAGPNPPSPEPPVPDRGPEPTPLPPLPARADAAGDHQRLGRAQDEDKTTAAPAAAPDCAEITGRAHAANYDP